MQTVEEARTQSPKTLCGSLKDDTTEDENLSNRTEKQVQTTP